VCGSSLGGMVPAQLIDGKAIATEIRKGVEKKLADYLKNGARIPTLAVILVGDNPASHIYVAHKEKACKAAGINSRTIRLEANATQIQVSTAISELNADQEVDGILLQLPLPSHLKKEPLIEQIDPDKDVDGLTPVNQGRLVWRQPGLYPCTPLGVLELIRSTGVALSGKVAAIVGRSVLVGMPAGILLENAGCTILGLHSESVDVKRWTREADIVVVATGVHNLVRKDWIKPGAIVVDVGIHRVGNRLAGDVDFAEVSKVAGHITPVPGGVGPMTIATLVSNCLRAYEWRVFSVRENNL